MVDELNRSRSGRAFRIAIICGAVPLVTGSAIFLIWCFTRWSWLIGAGIITLYAGVAMFLIGMGSLAFYRSTAVFSSDLLRKRGNTATLLCAIVLLSNFPVAAAIVYAANTIETRNAITIRNESAYPIEELRVDGRGWELRFDSIAPGQSAMRSFWVKGEDQLVFRGQIDRQNIEVLVDGYLTGGGCDYVVIVDREHNIAVTCTRR